jgi:hypothetical protein
MKIVVTGAIVERTKVKERGGEEIIQMRRRMKW